MNELLQDLGQSLRTIRKRPGFAAAIILSIALGVGANTAIFSVANLLLFRPLPYPEDQELMRIRSFLYQPGQEPQRSSISSFNIKALRDQASVFEGIAAWLYGTYNLVGGEEPVQVFGSMTSANALAVMGVEPMMGRGILPEEDEPGNAANVVVLSYALWQNQFGGAPDVVGRSVKIDDEPYDVIGVMPPLYEYPYMSKLWVPLGMDVNRRLRVEHVHHVVARLKEGVTMEQASEELDVIAKRLEQAHPDTNTNWRFGLMSVREDLTHEALDVQAHVVLVPLMAGAGFLLLIACANVANLILSRALEKSGDMAVRAALGAGRGRLVRLMITQGVFLALLGGAVGLVLAYWTFPPLVALSSVDQTNVVFQEIKLDYRVLVFTLLVSVAVGILFSLVPALKMSRANLQSLLMEGSRTTPSRSGRRLLKLAVVAEVAVTVVLLVGSGLMFRSLQRLHSVDVGFETENLLVFNLSLPDIEHTRLIAYLEQIVERVETQPGVVSAGVTSLFPLRSAMYVTQALPEGRSETDPDARLITNHRVIGPGFLETVGTQLLSGRTFTEHDQDGDEIVVVVSERFAKDTWPDLEDPVGQRVRMQPRSNAVLPWMTVVGVVRDVHDNGDCRYAWYVPYTQYILPTEFVDVVVRTSIDPMAVLPSIRDAVWSINKEQPIARVMTSDQLLVRQYWGQRSTTDLMVMFAVLGLLLAIIGIYSIQSYSVMQQVHEMGVRMVFGARQKDVMMTVLRQGMGLSLVGLVLGLGGAFLLTRFLGSLLYDVTPTDPLTFIVVSVACLGVALIANYLPARRATRVDPVEIIRY